MTPEEIAKKYLSNGNVEIEPELAAVEKVGADSPQDIAARYRQSVTQDTFPEEEKTKEKDKTGFFERSKDALQLGLSDAISTMAGDTHGRGIADATQKTPVNMAYRPVSALANVLTGVGNVVGDMVGSVDESIGSPLSKSIAMMIKNRDSHPIYRHSGLTRALNDLRKATPEYAPAIEEAGLVASSILPTKFLPTPNFRSQTSKLVESQKKTKEADIERRWEPDNTIEAEGAVTQTKGRDIYRRTDREIQMADDLASLDNLDPTKGYKTNVNTINDSVEKMRVDLDKKLRYAENLDVDSVLEGFPDVLKRIKEKATITGSPDLIGTKIYNEFLKRLKETSGDLGTINPKDLLQIRRDLDKWVAGSNKSSKVFDASTLTAQSVALKEIRDAINSVVIKATDDVDVAESLRNQSSLLTSRDNIMPKAVREPKTALGRAVAKIETETGLGAPQTPLALVSNITSWPAVIAGLTGTGAVLGKRGVQKTGRYAGAGLQKATQQAYLGGRGPLTLAAMTELIEKEENDAKK